MYEKRISKQEVKNYRDLIKDLDINNAAHAVLFKSLCDLIAEKFGVKNVNKILFTIKLE